MKLRISGIATAFSEFLVLSFCCESMAIAGSGQLGGELAINEIMYAPAGGEPEWIELRNMSAQELDIRGYLISDATVTSKHLISFNELRVFPGELLILTRDSTELSRFRTGNRGRIVSVTGFPSLNNGGDALYLYDNRGGVVDTVAYAPDWGGSGKSLERVDPTLPAQDKLNWGSCEATEGATPGKENSIGRKAFDVRPLSLHTEMNAGGSIELVGTVWNAGYRPADDLLLSFHDDVDGDSVAGDNELLARIPLANTIAPLDSQSIRWRWDLPGAGDHLIIMTTAFGADERSRNDTSRSLVRIAAPEGSLRINEIMFAPLSGEAEYIELANSTGQSVNIAGWRVTDRAGESGTANTTTISPGSHFIAPGEMAIVASDSGIFRFFPDARNYQNVIIPRSGLVSLNNDGDEVVLHDPSGKTVDSVAYSPTWHNPAVADRTGRSLERILVGGGSSEPANWTTCGLPEGGTPGRKNSVALAPSRSTARVSGSPNPFSPDNDGIDEATVVHYVLPEGVWILHIRIFDVRGRLIRRLATSVPCVGQGDVVWDGRDDQRVTARMGIYILFMEALDEQRGESITGKGVVVLAGRL